MKSVFDMRMRFYSLLPLHQWALRPYPHSGQPRASGPDGNFIAPAVGAYLGASAA